MSNVIDFPDRGEIQIEFSPDGVDRVDMIANQLCVTMAGLDAMTDATWEEVFRGALVATIFAGQAAGFEPSDVEEAFHSMRIEDGDDEGC